MDEKLSIVLEKIICDNSAKSMNEQERFNILLNEKIDEKVFCYLKNLFNELNVEVSGQTFGNLFDLMHQGRLEGWCWETTETASLFMPDDTTIFRANLHFSKYKTYYHSFIMFDFNGVNYIFDPCLRLINTADLFFKIFEVDVKGFVKAKDVKMTFINVVNNSSINELKQINEEEIKFDDNDDPNEPMYRNCAGYKNIIIENNKIKGLTAHYYSIF